MRILLFGLVLTLAGCSPSNPTVGGLGKETSKWVPDRTPLVSARQIMESHGFTCSTTSFGSLEQMTNRDDVVIDGPMWNVILERNGRRQAVTNLSYLDCRRTNSNNTCDVRFILLNGQTEGYRSSGSL